MFFWKSISNASGAYSLLFWLASFVLTTPSRSTLIPIVLIKSFDLKNKSWKVCSPRISMFSAYLSLRALYISFPVVASGLNSFSRPSVLFLLKMYSAIVIVMSWTIAQAWSSDITVPSAENIFLYSGAADLASSETT